MTPWPGSKLRNSQTLLAHLLLLAVVLVWGTTFSLVKAALADITPLLFNLLRMTLAFLVLAAVNRPSLRQITPAELKLGVAAGLFLGLGYQLQTSGLMHTSASRAAFITGLVVVIVPLLSAVPGVLPNHPLPARPHTPPPASTSTDNLSADPPFDPRNSASVSPNSPLDPGSALRPTLDTYAGALLAFSGLVLLTTPPGLGLALFAGIGLGEWLCLGCALAFAAHLLTLARAAPVVPARRLATLQIGFAAILMLLTLPLQGRPHFHSTALVWLALAVTAVLATAAAFTIQSWAQQHLPPSHTALILTLEPVFAWLTSLLFLGERLGPRGLLGAGLILAGILLAELRPITRGRSQLLPINGA
ncbi:MAG: DMT family transporter [Acidobacteriaceae bacterium]